MSTPRPTPGRVAVLGAGPAGMAAALRIIKAGHEVVLYERYREARPAGNILNLWPPPLKALRALGVDTSDLGAPTDSEFRSISGRVRVRVKIDPEVERAYGGGFIGLLRPELYVRMLAAIPLGCIRFGQQVEAIEQNERVVILHFADGTTAEHDLLVGADGIDSLVRSTLWGDVPKREHRLHIFGGYTFADVPGTRRKMSVISHGPAVQGSWTDIRYEGRSGFQWWVLSAADPAAPRRPTSRRPPPASPPRSQRRCPGLSPRPSPATSSAGCCGTARRCGSGARDASRWPATPRTPPRPTPPTAPACRSRTATSSASPCAALTWPTWRRCGARSRRMRDRASRTPPGRCRWRGGAARSSPTPRRRCARCGTCSSTTPRSCRRW